MQCACTILSSVACPALQYFSTSFHKGRDFREKKNTVTKMSMLILSTTFFFFPETFLILRRSEQDMIENVYGSSCKVRVILFPFLMKLEFSQQLFGKYSNQI